MTERRQPRRGHWCNGCGGALADRSVFRLSLGGAQPAAQYYCARCAQIRLRCAACGRPLDAEAGQLFALPDHAGRLFCATCWGRPHCHACGRPVGELSYRRIDGRVLCDQCHATAVYDPALAAALYSAVQETARHVLDMELRVGAALHLATREQLAALRRSGPAGGAERQSGTSTADYVGLFLYQWPMRAVYVEYGLPRIFFCEVVAHEYAHVWQAENAPLLADPELREGFAEWVAYKVIESWGCRLRLERFRQRQDMYGAGLRRILGWEAAVGPAGVLERIGRER